MDLKKICSERLKEAEGKIEFLAKAPDGKIIKESAVRDNKEKEKKHSFSYLWIFEIIYELRFIFFNIFTKLKKDGGLF